MNILGFEIKRKTIAEPQPDFDQRLLSAPTQRKNPLGYMRQKSMWDVLVFPSDVRDDWEKLAITRFMREIQEDEMGGHNPHFSICDLDNYMKAMKIPFNNDTHDSYRKLRQLHCVGFRDIPAGIFKMMPHLVNHVISQGQLIHPSLRDDILDI